MIAVAVSALVLGVLCGRFVFSADIISFFAAADSWFLYALMFSVGISVGANRTIFRKLREYHVKILVIPLGIVLGSLAGGALGSLVAGPGLRESLAVASGMGWYSLSGVLLTDLGGASLGSTAFLANLMREIFSFMIIPLIARWFNEYTCIAPAGATSEDTTLPMMVKYTGEEVVVMSVLNGVICSLLVPILINLLYSL